jgi:hypothetical protein
VIVFDKGSVKSAFGHDAATRVARRRFLRAVGLTGLGVGAVSVAARTPASAAPAISDAAFLNFLLNLEYLEAEFYSRAISERGVPFQTPNLRSYANTIGYDAREHIAFLRGALGSAAIAQPTIDLGAGFTGMALGAGLTQPGETFDAFANDRDFLLGAFFLEDVGVTAFKGVVPLLSDRALLNSVVGILAVKATHAGIIRTSVYDMGLQAPAGAISEMRARLGGGKDEGFYIGDATVMVPADEQGLAYGRTPGEVLNILYLTQGRVSSGGFFPMGVNGELKWSG